MASSLLPSAFMLSALNSSQTPTQFHNQQQLNAIHNLMQAQAAFAQQHGTTNHMMFRKFILYYCKFGMKFLITAGLTLPPGFMTPNATATPTTKKNNNKQKQHTTKKYAATSKRTTNKATMHRLTRANTKNRNKRAHVA